MLCNGGSCIPVMLLLMKRLIVTVLFCLAPHLAWSADLDSAKVAYEKGGFVKIA